MTEFTVIDGMPREEHKSTEIAESVANDRSLWLDQNHELTKEQAVKHLGGDQEEYGQEQSRVVQFTGRQYACSECPLGDHSYENGNEKLGHEDAARTIMSDTSVVTPEKVESRFPSLCTYKVLYECLGVADHITTVPELLSTVTDQIAVSEFHCVIDEETALEWFYPGNPSLFEFTDNTAGVGQELQIQNGKLSDVEAVRDRIQRKIDEYERVPRKYRDALKAADALTDLKTRITAAYRDSTGQAEFTNQLEEIHVPSVDIRDPTEVVEYIRQDLRNTTAAPLLEPFLVGGKIYTEYSRNSVTAFLTPDPAEYFIHHGDVLQQFKHIHLVGRTEAAFFARLLDDTKEQDLDPSDYAAVTDDLIDTRMVGQETSIDHDLTVIQVKDRVDRDDRTSDRDEQGRRRALTKAAGRIADSGVPTLHIAGSRDRAEIAVRELDGAAYLFAAGSRSRHADQITDHTNPAWTTVSYMGSRLTRGVDVPTQVTVVRSTQFSTARWTAWQDYLLVQFLAKYRRYIETFNAMLRGAGQGRPHVAIIPVTNQIYWWMYHGAEFLTVNYQDVDEIVDTALEAVGETPETQCVECGREFVTPEGYIEHNC